jgi:hypothetical protein
VPPGQTISAEISERFNLDIAVGTAAGDLEFHGSRYSFGYPA